MEPIESWFGVATFEGSGHISARSGRGFVGEIEAYPAAARQLVYDVDKSAPRAQEKIW